MKDNIFVDTNVLVYLFDKSEEDKNKRSKDLIKKLRNDFNLVISSQVLNEFITVVTGKIENPIALANVKGILDYINKIFYISPLTSKDSFFAVDLKIKYKYSYWDSLIIASALENKCTRLYTEDLHDGQVIEEKLTTVNPYKLEVLEMENDG